VEPELLGSLHEFEFDQCQIKIELPGKNALPQQPLLGDKASLTAADCQKYLDATRALLSLPL
jgi:hypothetical protein